MRSYRQHCAAARALDVIGDRWSLLIVRELLLRDCRFTDLADGLTGIATNLLTERLRSLEAAGVIEHVSDQPAGYRLTPRGRGLAPVVRSLIVWGMPMMIDDPGEDTHRGRWVAGCADALFAETETDGLPPLRALLHADGETIRVVVDPGTPVDISLLGAPDTNDASVEVRAPQRQMLALLAGLDAEAQIIGDETALRALIARGRAPLIAGGRGQPSASKSDRDLTAGSGQGI
jgi:DNA-binding HxlR family transcriptional regulator